MPADIALRRARVLSLAATLATHHHMSEALRHALAAAHQLVPHHHASAQTRAHREAQRGLVRRAVAQTRLRHGGAVPVVAHSHRQLHVLRDALPQRTALPVGDRGGGVDDVARAVDGAARADAHGDGLSGGLVAELVQQRQTRRDDALATFLRTRALNRPGEHVALRIHDRGGDLGSADVQRVGASRDRADSLLHRLGVLLRYPHGTRDHAAHHNRMGSHAKQTTRVLGRGDSTLANHGHLHGLGETLHQREIGTLHVRRVRRVSGKRGSHDIRSCLRSRNALFECGNVRHDETPVLLLDLLDHFNTRRSVGVRTIRDVQRDDVRSRLHDVLHTVHV